MKATGIVRRVDELGRIVIPKELRDTLGIKERDKLEIYVEGDMIILHKYAPGCVFCGETRNVRDIHGTAVCGNCACNMQMLYRTAETDE